MPIRKTKTSLSRGKQILPQSKVARKITGQLTKLFKMVSIRANLGLNNIKSCLWTSHLSLQNPKVLTALHLFRIQMMRLQYSLSLKQKRYMTQNRYFINLLIIKSIKLRTKKIRAIIYKKLTELSLKTIGKTKKSEAILKAMV